MRVIAFNGSPRKKWNTATLLKNALEGAESQGAETELVHLYDLNFKDGLILVFIHYNSGVPFTTIRRNYKEKFEYYSNAIGETFVLTSTQGQQS